MEEGIWYWHNHGGIFNPHYRKGEKECLTSSNLIDLCLWSQHFLLGFSLGLWFQGIWFSYKALSARVPWSWQGRTACLYWAARLSWCHKAVASHNHRSLSEIPCKGVWEGLCVQVSFMLSCSKEAHRSEYNNFGCTGSGVWKCYFLSTITFGCTAPRAFNDIV